ncbi:hypothetical protein MTO96_041586 [Rhipicephalus appendiculatus]
MPRDHMPIIVRTRGGLDVKKVCTIRLAQAMAMAAALVPDEVGEDIVCNNAAENILVVSTPMRKNACAYAAVQQIHLKEGKYDVAAYLAASNNTCKGVVRSVDADFSHVQLRTVIVNRRKPTALEVRRIKTTTTVVVLFEGMKVPNHVMCGSGMLPCTLYRRQVDVCYSCGNLGHRAVVYPNPSEKKCRGCGLASPVHDHKCTPECTICGGRHLTADRKCKQRFQLPYIVRQRRRRRRRTKKSQASQGDRSRDSSVASAPGRARSQSPAARQRSLSRGRPRSRSNGRSRSRGPSRSKGRSQSRARNQEGLTWADRAKQNTDKGPKKALRGTRTTPEYRGEPAEELDAPVTKAEVVKVLQELNGRSAPGLDGISNRLLRNLDDKSIEKLAEEINVVRSAAPIAANGVISRDNARPNRIVRGALHIEGRVDGYWAKIFGLKRFFLCPTITLT